MPVTFTFGPSRPPMFSPFSSVERIAGYIFGGFIILMFILVIVLCIIQESNKSGSVEELKENFRGPRAAIKH
jgi:phage-related holin